MLPLLLPLGRAHEREDTHQPVTGADACSRPDHLYRGGLQAEDTPAAREGQRPWRATATGPFLVASKSYQ